MASLAADLYQELRRLSIAGGELGAGDFRLAKILPQLKGAAEKAPVFGKLAAGVEKISSPDTSDRSAAILETAALARAVMCVQAKPEPALGELSPLPETGLKTAVHQCSYLAIGPLKAALTTKGRGGRAALKAGIRSGAVADLRLLADLHKALDDGDKAMALMVGQALARIGRPAVLGLLADFKPKSLRKAEVQRLAILGRILGAEGQTIYARAWAEGSAPVRRQALELLARSPENDAVLLGALAGDVETAGAAAAGIADNRRQELMAPLAEAAAELLGQVRPVYFSRKAVKPGAEQDEYRESAQKLIRFLAFLSALGRSRCPRTPELARAALAAEWRGLELSDLARIAGVALDEFMDVRWITVHGLCLKTMTPFDREMVLAEIRTRLADPGELDSGLVKIAAAYCCRALRPAEVNELFRPLLKKGQTKAEKALMELLKEDAAASLDWAARGIKLSGGKGQ